MESKDKFIYIGQGVIRGLILTLLLLVAYSIITYYLKSNPKIDSVYFVVITAFSVMYGTIYSVGKIQRKGWLIGLIVAILYILIVFLASAVNGRGFNITSYGILRMMLALFVGTLSGMLGVNI